MRKENLLEILKALNIPVVNGKVHRKNALAAIESKKRTLADRKITKSELEALINENNKKYGTNFSLGEAYGNMELWSDEKDRLEAGSLKDCYNAFVKARFQEKYRIKAEHEEQPATSGSKEIAKLDAWLRGEKKSFGDKPDSCWADGDTLYSYNTVIAKKHGSKLFLNKTPYSKTTSQYQSYIKQNPGKWQVVEKDEDFFNTSMEHKLEGKGYW